MNRSSSRKSRSSQALLPAAAVLFVGVLAAVLLFEGLGQQPGKERVRAFERSQQAAHPQPTLSPPAGREGIELHRESNRDQDLVLHVVDAQGGEGVAGAEITAWRRGRLERRFVTDARGTARLPPRLENCRLSVEKEGFMPRSLVLTASSLRVALRRARLVTLQALNQFQEPVAGLRLVLEPARPADAGSPAKTAQQDLARRPASDEAIPLVTREAPLTAPVPQDWDGVRCSIQESTTVVVYQWTQSGRRHRILGDSFTFRPDAGPLTLGVGQPYYVAYRLAGRNSILTGELAIHAKGTLVERANYWAQSALAILERRLSRAHPDCTFAFVLPTNKESAAEASLPYLDCRGRLQSFRLRFRPLSKEPKIETLVPEPCTGGVRVRFAGVVDSQGAPRSERFCRQLLERARVSLGRYRKIGGRDVWFQYRFTKVGETFRVPPGTYRWGAFDVLAYQAVETERVELDESLEQPVRLVLKFRAGWDLTIVDFRLVDPKDPKRLLVADFRCTRWYKGLSVPTWPLKDNQLQLRLPPGKYTIYFNLFSDGGKKVRKDFVLNGEEFVHHVVEID